MVIKQLEIKEVLFKAALIVLCLATFSCSKQSDVIEHTIADEFEVYLTQELSEVGPSFALFVRTLFDQNCQESELISAYTFENDQLWLNIESLEEKGACDGGAYLIDTTLAYNLPFGTFDFSITLKNAIPSVGSVTHNLNGFELYNFSDINGVILGETEVIKIPQNIFWVSILNNDEEELARLATDLETILANAATKTELQSGNYGHFEVDENKILLPARYEDVVVRDDYYRAAFNLLDEEGLQDAIQLFRTENPELNMQLTTWTGKSY